MSASRTADTAVAVGVGQHGRSPYVTDGQLIMSSGEQFEVLVPVGLAIVDLAAQRLARRLHRAGDGVDSLVAPVAPLPAGTSARVDAARRFVEPERPLVAVAGAARGCTVRRLGVTAEPPRVRADPDVVCQDLDARLQTPPADAVPEGRPVLTSRPVALLVAVDHDPRTAELGRVWANALVEQGIEARLAVPDPADGRHLTIPCRPGQATVAALRPDVIVALDPSAAERADAWDAGSHAVEIHRDDTAVVDHPERVALVSWRLGETRGNVRCRVGSDVDPVVLAALIDRFCGLPPRRDVNELEAARPGRRSSAVDVLIPRRRGVTRPQVASVEIVGRARTDGEAAYWDGIADQFAALGCSVNIAPAAVGTSGPDLRLWGNPAAALAGGAGRSPRLAAVLLTHADLAATGHQPVTDEARQALTAVGAALTPSPDVERFLSGMDLPVRRLPHFLGREHLRDLRAASVTARGTRSRVVGWQLAGSVSDAEAEVVRDALLAVADRRSDVRIDLTGDDVASRSQLLPAALRRDPSSAAAAVQVAECRVQVWTPAPGHVESTGRFGRGLEAMLARVPVVAAPLAGASLGRLGRAVASPSDPADPRSWASTIERALDGHGVDPERGQIQARMLHGDQAAAVRGHRILGWLSELSRR